MSTTAHHVHRPKLPPLAPSIEDRELRHDACSTLMEGQLPVATRGQSLLGLPWCPVLVQLHPPGGHVLDEFDVRVLQ